MKKVALLVVSLAAIGAVAMVSTAGATGPAPYNTPKQTAKYTAGMVTAYAQCTAPNASHRPALALPSCTPPVASSSLGLNGNTDLYTFGLKNGAPDGSASLTLQATTGDVKLSAKSKAVWQNGAAFTSSPGPVPPDNRLVGTAVVRATDTGCLDPVNPTIACTLVDFPFPVKLNCTAGSCKTAGATANAVTPNAVHAGDTSNIEVGQVTIVEAGVPPQDTVARQGLLVK